MKNILKLLLLLTIVGCSSDVEEKKFDAKIQSVTPSRVKIGDTITVTGENLYSLLSIPFNHKNGDFSSYNERVDRAGFITHTNDKITLEVPKLYEEDITIGFSGIDLKLYGIFPLAQTFSSIRLQVLNENIAYVRDGNKIYKSTDGFYTWNQIVELPTDFGAGFYFLNENQGWFAVRERGVNETKIYYTNDGGNTISIRYDIGNLNIERMEFISVDKGCFVGNDNNIYVADGNSFVDIYTYYPDLNTLPFGKIDLFDFNIINEDLIFLLPFEPYVIKINSQTASYSEFNNFDPQPTYPMFFNSIGYNKVRTDLYKTTNQGNTWSKIRTFDDNFRLRKINFFNDKEGFATTDAGQGIYGGGVYYTNNGGVDWEEYFYFSQFHNSKEMKFTSNNGLFSTVGVTKEYLWKFIKE